MSKFNTLQDRISHYAENCDYKMLRKLPVVTIINGRSFSKVTSLFNKPFSHDFMDMMCSVMLKLVHEIDGSIFGYLFNDEIIIISRNDQSNETNPWYDNKIQSIVSAASAIATLELNNNINLTNNNFVGDALFTAKTFTVPNITETINVLISKQQQAIQTSVTFACFYELIKKYDNQTIKDILSGRTFEEKIEILKDECKIDYNLYPMEFKRGVACYRVPSIIIGKNDEEIIKNKWTINHNIPIFTKDHTFLKTIFNYGSDIFRADRDI